MLDGRVVRFASPRDALAAGVAIVHQELAFCENMTVAENLCLGRLPSRFGFVDRDALRATQPSCSAQSVRGSTSADRWSRSASPSSSSCRSRRRVGSGASVIVFDEPTSSLDEGDVARLFALIGELRARGVTIIYVSHRMAEIYRLCDAITVLRDGRHVATRPIAEVDEAELVRLMIGRTLEQYFPGARRRRAWRRAAARRQICRAARSFRTSHSRCTPAKSSDSPGSSAPAGRRSPQTIFGLELDRRVGSISRARTDASSIHSPRDAMARGIGFVPEDRKKQGLVLSMRAGDNSTLPDAGRARALWMDRSTTRASRPSRSCSADCGCGHRRDVVTASLSGGNQQKVVMAKWLAANSDILILDEPTRGVDVGAKAEIHAWIDELAGRGCAVLLISSELPELINLSSRILVLRHGRLVG